MELLKTEKAPEAIGPYSQGTKANGFVYVSGQLPIDMETSELVTDDVRKAARASLTNVLEIIKSAGGKLEDILKVNVYVTDISDFDEINKEYAEFFQDHKPARALVEVCKLPKNAVIEIEAVAYVG